MPVPESHVVVSPDGRVRATLAAGGDGLTLAVSLTEGGTHADAEVLTVDGLGLVARGDQSATDDANVEIAGRSDRTIDETYATTSGKRRHHRHQAAEAVFTLARGEERLELVVRVAGDGVAYRHRLLGKGTAFLRSERAVATMSPGSRVWLAPYVDNYETQWRGGLTAADLADDVAYGLPVLFSPAAGVWGLLTEAEVDGTFAASHVRTAKGGFALTLPEERVSSTLPWATPWRVAVVGDLATVFGSDLVTDLNPPSRLDDVDWVRPGRVAWSWWSQADSPSDPQRQREYVDFASANGWEYVLVDAGWDAAWMPDLVRYAADRGVGIIVWTHWTRVETQAQRDELLPLWRSWGVVGVKVDFMDCDSQARMAWYEEFARDAAAARLMVNYHGATMPKGHQRTWPHVLTYEGICGGEQYARRAGRDGGWVVPYRDGPDPVHNTIVPFTRNAVGSMDYTPVTFSAPRRSTSAAHELALAVVFESGWQHYADSVEAYERRPVARRMLSRIPAAWDDSRLLMGEPGSLVAVARREQDRWYVAAIAAGPARRVSLSLGFLDAGVTYDATLVEDGLRGDFGDGPGGGPEEELVERAAVVTADETLEVSLSADGGVVVELLRRG